MAEDIVERLREKSAVWKVNGPLMGEAADLIERLREENRLLRKRWEFADDQAGR